MLTSGAIQLIDLLLAAHCHSNPIFDSPLLLLDKMPCVKLATYYQVVQREKYPQKE